MSLRQRFASAVFHARKEMGITQDQAAEALGISTGWFQQIEYGHVVPGGELVIKIFVFFGINGIDLREDLFVDVSVHNR